MNIAFDIDNVIWDFMSLFKKKFQELGFMYNDSIYYNFLPESYNVKNLITDLIQNRSDELLPYPEVEEYLYKFYILFNKEPLIFLTARYEETYNVTVRYMKKYFPNIEFKVFLCEEDKKDEFLKDYEYFVDDKIENLLPCMNEKKKRLYLINRPWNMELDNLPKIIMRVNNLKEVYEDYYEKENSCGHSLYHTTLTGQTD